MTIKSKISFYISIVFSVLFALICIYIIKEFSEFRKEEFKNRLKEKALLTIRLLIEVKELDKNILQKIDKNTINELHDEKTLIFDAKYNLIYSSLDDTKINWSINDLKELKKTKEFLKKESNNEIYGFFYDTNNDDYFAIVSAYDSYGKRKLNYLIYLLLFSGIVFIVCTWLISFYIIKKQLLPLTIFHKKIREINDLNKQTTLESNINSQNEIDLLSIEFNSMMNRIIDVYQNQKEFTSNVSHEFRTPLARISAQIENQINIVSNNEKVFFKNILSDIDQLNELINSLLILSKIDHSKNIKNEKSRIDEAIYNSIEKVIKEFSDFKVNFNIDDIEDLETLLEATCNNNLIEIVFSNILKNAYLYSDNKTALIELKSVNKRLVVQISNTGETIQEKDYEKIFLPFVRGENTKHKKGLGLGLKIVKRILSIYEFSITYTSIQNKNIFVIKF